MIKHRCNQLDMTLAADFQSNTAVATDMSRIAGIILSGGYPEIQHKSLRARRFWFKSYLEGRLFKDFESLHAARGDYHSKLQALVPYLAGLSNWLQINLSKESCYTVETESSLSRKKA